MTIQELLKSNDIFFTVKYKEKNTLLLDISNYSVLVLLNNSSSFKMKRSLFEEMIKISEKQIYILIDNTSKKYYFMKFPKANNWLSSGFYNCDKQELFLGKQVLNYQKSLSNIMSELKNIKYVKFSVPDQNIQKHLFRRIKTQS